MTRRMGNRHALAAAIAAAALMAASCELRPLYIEGETPVEVLVLTDWTQLGADPTGSTITFFPEGGGTPWTFKTNSVARTTVKVPSGRYTVQVFNRTVDEFGSMRFTGMEGLPTERAVLEDKSFAWPAKADTVGRLVYEPEEIVVGRTDNFTVRPMSERETVLRSSGLEPGSSVPVIDSVLVTPQRVRYRGTASVRILGIHNIRSMRAYLTGMAGDAYLASRTGGAELATHVIESWTPERDATDYTRGYVRGSFFCFGLPEQHLGMPAPENNRLLMEFRLVDNRTVIKELRLVGACVYQNDRDRTVNVAVEGEIILPDVKPEDGSESGFDISFTDWEDPIDIPIGI